MHLNNLNIAYISNTSDPNTLNIIPQPGMGTCKTEDGTKEWNYNASLPIGNRWVLNNKQDLLVSGNNIKTINGQNILGSGNLAIAGGSSSPLETRSMYSNLLGNFTIPGSPSGQLILPWSGSYSNITTGNKLGNLVSNEGILVLQSCWCYLTLLLNFVPDSTGDIFLDIRVNTSNSVFFSKTSVTQGIHTTLVGNSIASFNTNDEIRIRLVSSSGITQNISVFEEKFNILVLG